MGIVEKYENEVHVTLPNGFKVRFFITGLKTKEYIKRAEDIYRLETERKKI